MLSLRCRYLGLSSRKFVAGIVRRLPGFPDGFIRGVQGIRVCRGRRDVVIWQRSLADQARLTSRQSCSGCVRGVVAVDFGELFLGSPQLFSRAALAALDDGEFPLKVVSVREGLVFFPQCLACLRGCSQCYAGGVLQSCEDLAVLLRCGIGGVLFPGQRAGEFAQIAMPAGGFLDLPCQSGDVVLVPGEICLASVQLFDPAGHAVEDGCRCGEGLRREPLLSSSAQLPAGVLLLLLKAKPAVGGPGFQTRYLTGSSGDARQLAGDIFLLVTVEGGPCGAQLRVPVACGCCPVVAVSEVTQGLVQVAGLLLGLLGGGGRGCRGSLGVMQQAAAGYLGLVGQLSELVTVTAARSRMISSA